MYVAQLDLKKAFGKIKHSAIADLLQRWSVGWGAVGMVAGMFVATTLLTELVNNAVDHSDAATVTVRADLTGSVAAVTIEDEGVGALERLRSGLGLEDHLHAVQELSKGKVTNKIEWLSANDTQTPSTSGALRNNHLPAVDPQLSRRMLHTFFFRYNAPLRLLANSLDPRSAALWDGISWAPATALVAADAAGEGGLRAFWRAAAPPGL